LRVVGAWRKEAALLLCLLFLAGGITIASQRVVPPLLGLRVPSVVRVGGTGSAVVGPNSTLGTLLIEAQSVAGVQSTSPSNLTSVPVSVVLVGRDSFPPKTYETNTTGGMELTLPAENYSVSFFNLPMNVSVPISVHEDRVTYLSLMVRSGVYQGLYLSLPTNSTDVAPAWSHGTIEVGSPITFGGSTQAFLDLSYSGAEASTTTALASQLSPLLITGSELDPHSSSSHQWIDFESETEISLQGVSSVGLEVLSAYTNVTTSAPIPNYLGGA